VFERFTEKARRAIFFARYEASQYGSAYIEAEHLLLGLLREDQRLIRSLLRAGESIRKEIESRITIRERISTSVEVPLTPECKRVLHYAVDEANRLGHRHVGTEHFLLGILREEKCMAAEILRERGVQLATVRDQIKATQKPDLDMAATRKPELDAAGEMAARLAGVWNDGDPVEFAALVVEEGEFVDAQGTLWKGTRETGQGFVDLHARDCKGSKIASAASDILSVSYDVVVLRIDWQLAGAKGSEHRRLHWMLVLAQFGGMWEIVAAQSLIVRS